MEGAWKLGRADLAAPARRVLETLDSMDRAEGLTRVYNSGGPLPWATGQFLNDRAHFLNALLDAHAWLPDGDKYLGRAKEVARGILDRYFDDANGGFFDVDRDAEAPGYLQVREKPLPENVAAVNGLLKLHQATGDDTYREAARRTLSAYVEANGVWGEFAAGYAVAVDQFLHRPVEVTLEGHPGNADTGAMLQAMLNVPYPHLIIRPASAGVDSPARAHICVDTLCLPPVSNPAELGQAVQEAVSPRQSPLENIFGSLI
jgi:uncharacterized protein YyaL (SSP411 family)